MHNTRPFSKTHPLMLAMKGADKKRKQVTSGQTYTHTQHTTPFCKTHKLIRELKVADKERNTLLLVKHIHVYNTRTLSNENSPTNVGNGGSRQGVKQVNMVKHAQHN